MHYSSSTNTFYPDELQEAYRVAGSWPEDAVAVTDEEWQVYSIGQPPAGHRRSGDENGHPVWVPEDPVPLEELAMAKRAEVEADLEAELAKGMPCTMPNGKDDVVQILTADRQNLLGLAIEARDLQAAGVTDATQEFRAMSNIQYPMKPAEMIALTDSALGHYRALLNKSWTLKNAIDAALATEDRNAIEAITW
ncbi:hypothetical protein HCU01_33500 [Halomonas cupida]|uniref:DUF4376 domain-containing protein n=1 Tax=Halomonas cupida TaxID=44933 RepID=A0A1M7KGP8_9GAMM|nr:tail fiber assembly protein [Halomonas cupida]GEN25401.1 hypothetical protein HCU01_33500 [Halomonas cupida]SHM64507.1 protein of unknown function [Halomonas cupida]